ncbi:helix-turn-helix transcriptional regulator [Rubellimicrobium roseum]|uniref:AlpA family phage regulatory protein n=1 Tax=Rubellimicrobium roseum TaxID=687525 RepID=A0A5C4N3U6_9RHOB|nr:AlpA family phage regulatory protein [Rubellimicrobium roseum]TNC61327.1 AlpA family phage regulatory protein [Rubellimicrobium roseum]
MPVNLVRLPDVRARTGLATSTIYELISRGAFPRPIRISTRAVAWIETDLDSWLAERMTERDQTAKRNSNAA